MLLLEALAAAYTVSPMIRMLVTNAGNGADCATATPPDSKCRYKRLVPDVSCPNTMALPAMA